MIGYHLEWKGFIEAGRKPPAYWTDEDWRDHLRINREFERQATEEIERNRAED